MSFQRQSMTSAATPTPPEVPASRTIRASEIEPLVKPTIPAAITKSASLYNYGVINKQKYFFHLPNI
jgi:hypothetical protein